MDLLAADAVGDGQVVGEDHDGVELVVWRTFEGRACVQEARCPHLFSHLAAEGVVDGDELVCAAHLWRFTRRGTGWLIGGDGRRSPVTDLRTYPCQEQDGRIVADLSEA